MPRGNVLDVHHDMVPARLTLDLIHITTTPITLPPDAEAYSLDYAGATAISLPAPPIGRGIQSDARFLVFSSTVAQAHVITSPVVGFNGKGSSGTATFGAAKGNAVGLLGINGNWYVIFNIGVTIA